MQSIFDQTEGRKSWKTELGERHGKNELDSYERLLGYVEESSSVFRKDLFSQLFLSKLTGCTIEQLQWTSSLVMGRFDGHLIDASTHLKKRIDATTGGENELKIYRSVQVAAHTALGHSSVLATTAEGQPQIEDIQ